MKELRPFHLAVPVKDLEKSRSFYRDVMGFAEGRSSDKWVDFNFFGHQFVIHEVASRSELSENPVDGHHVPVPHFGVVLEWSQLEALRDQLVGADISFVIDPYIRFKGEPGEQATMFFLDPSGNALEFKSFRNDAEIFSAGNLTKNRTHTDVDAEVEMLRKRLSDHAFYTSHTIRHPLATMLAIIDLIQVSWEERSKYEKLIEQLKIEAMNLDDAIRVMTAKIELD